MDESLTTPAPRERARVVLLVTMTLVGAVLVAVGAAIIQRGPFSVGWFAYAPVSTPTVSYPSTPWHWAPYLLGAGGMLVGGAVGYVLARRAVATR
ncbi:hypothetical protein [Cellulomonas sp.]|uniref:hypothetical protein n=1 Tax=Cellulomonas sp. TaxID=40001 RepID=UPI001B0CA7FC|nr:hypothetical protein [Cellulomonas sp.]MBO9554901.1 hypothetical protein [Cellulomonas sp.]